MQESPYKIRQILKRRPAGITEASYCTLDAILRFDGPESPHCVYIEHVALRLAQTFHITVADGALIVAGDGPAYASLEVAAPGIPLPNVLDSQCERIARKYPDEVAALTAFDILIGNWDRKRNLKASIVTPHIRLFKNFNHSHALLNIKEDPDDSIAVSAATTSRSGSTPSSGSSPRRCWKGGWTAWLPWTTSTSGSAAASGVRSGP